MNSGNRQRVWTWIAAASLSAAAVCLAQGPAAPAPKAPRPKPAQSNPKAPELKPDELKKIEDALPAAAAAKPAKPRRILVFWRCEGFFHGSGIAGANKAIELMGAKTGAYTTDFSADYSVFDAANLAAYDAVVFNNTTRLTFPDDAKKQALLEFVRGGKGIVGIHAATDSFYDWPEAAAMIGGLFSGHPWGGGGTWAVKIDEPDHVLTKAFGGKGFKLQDEIYQFKDPYTRADRRVLLSLDLSDPATGGKGGRADKDYAVSWIKTVGQGRAFYCSLGHASNVFQVPDILKYYLDGIQYALGDLAADATPRK